MKPFGRAVPLAQSLVLHCELSREPLSNLFNKIVIRSGLPGSFGITEHHRGHAAGEIRS